MTPGRAVPPFNSMSLSVTGWGHCRHGLVRADQLNEACTRMVAGDKRYRIVLDTSTLQAPAEEADT